LRLPLEIIIGLQGPQHHTNGAHQPGQSEASRNDLLPLGLALTHHDSQKSQKMRPTCAIMNVSIITA
jgi:hypothetical protein